VPRFLPAASIGQSGGSTVQPRSQTWPLTSTKGVVAMQRSITVACRSLMPILRALCGPGERFHLPVDSSPKSSNTGPATPIEETGGVDRYGDCLHILKSLPKIKALACLPTVRGRKISPIDNCCQKA